MLKKVITLVVTASALNVMACPDLTGTYICKFSDKTEKWINTQKTENSATTYQFNNWYNNTEMVADSQLHSTSIKGLANARYTATCDESVVTHLDADVIDNNGKTIGSTGLHLIIYKMDAKLRVVEIGWYDAGEDYVNISREADCQPE